MKHISTILSEEELQQICQIIGPKQIKAQFRRNPKEFNWIRPGFRASSLSDEEAILLAIRNIKHPLITRLIHGSVEQWLCEITECRHNAEEQGATSEEALITVLSQSLFNNNVALYFRIAEEEHTPEFIAAIQAAVNVQRQFNEKIASSAQAEEPPLQQSSLQEQICSLETELSASQEQLNTLSASHMHATEKISELQQAIVDAEARYSVMAEQHSALQVELTRYQKMERYADTIPEYTPTEEYPYVSLCQVYTNSSGNLALYRLADIDHGEIIKFARLDGIPTYFANREKLFWKDGPDEVGYIGVWQWNAIPNRSDPSIDYVLTHFDQDMHAIEIIECSDCNSYADIVELITNRTIHSVKGQKLLITTKASQGRMLGLLCKANDFTVTGGSMHLKNSVLSLPQFEIALSDTIILAGHRFYRHMSLGLPVGIHRVRHPLSIVREVVLSRATSTALRMQGMSKKEAQHCQSFLKEMPIDSVLQEISDTCDCSLEEAQEYVTQFIAQADSYLCDTDMDIGTLSAAITRNTTLVEQCKQLLTAEWKEENAEKRAHAQAQLDEVQAQVATAQSALSAIEEKKTATLAEIDQLHQTIKALEALAADVEVRVMERINAARENAATFLADMAFKYPYSIGSGMGSVEPQTATQEKLLIARQGASVKENYQISDPDDFFDELADNLYRVGYSKQAVNDYAQSIMFCIDNHMPIICGYNAEAIADCIAAMFGTTGAFTSTVPIATGDGRSICESIDQHLAVNDAPIVVLLCGVFDGYSNNSFSQIMQYSAAWGERVVLLISTEGLEPSSIPYTVWNRTMFIDGDFGINHTQSEKLHAHCTGNIFGTDYAIDAVHEKLKSFSKFSGVISNVALLNFAKYLVFTDGTLEKDEMLQRQILRYGWSARQSDKVVEILNDLGIDTSEMR